jgi:uncharacterized repeat protein (TIGR01451 family)
VKFDAPSGYILTQQDQGGDETKDSDANPSTGRTEQTTLDAGEDDLTWDAGIYKVADLSLTKEVNATTVYAGDTVRFTITVHNDGPSDATGVVATDVVPSGYSGVTNLSSGASLSGSTVTMNVGTLANGAEKTFTFDATVEEGGEHTNWAEITAMNEADTDSNVSTDHTVDDLGDGVADDDEDSASVTLGAKASLGDTVWEDTNRNGIQDAGESGVAGVTVHLYKDGADTGTTATTDGDGRYRFNDLEPGNYSVKFDAPSGYILTQQDQGGDETKDSDANPSTGRTEQTTLDAGEDDLTWDAGIYKVAASVKIGNLIWIEDDNDGNPATGTITHPPAGTVVTAKGSDGTHYTGTTDVHGHYTITVPVDDTYMVTVHISGFYVPTAGSDDSAIYDTVSEDNHSHNGEGTTVAVTTVDNMSADFGFTPPSYAHIGDYFWIDQNGDGIQDSSEPVVEGASVELFDADGNPIKDIHGNHVVVTDMNGKYGFDVEPNRTYMIRFIIPDRYLEDGYVFTNPHVGSDDGADNDVADNGYTVTISPDVGDNVLTLDAGIACGCAGVAGDSINSMNKISLLLMIFGVFVLIFIVLRQEDHFA